MQGVSAGEEHRRLLVSRHRLRALGWMARTTKVQIGREFQLLDPVPSPVGQPLDPVELAANKVLTV